MKYRLTKIVLLITGIVIIILLLTPGIIKRYTINNSLELAGRQMDLKKIKINYFTSTIKVIDFKMHESNEEDNFLSFDTLIVNFEPLRLLKNKIEIESFYLKGLDVNVVMKDSTFNFEDIIAFHKDEDSINNDPFKYSISNLELNDADFHFNNQDIEHITDINNISFLVPFIGWDQEHKSNADVKFNFKNGGYIESIFNFHPIEGSYDASFTISDLYLNSFYKYVAEYAEINSFEGSVDSEVIVKGNINDPLKSIVSGVVNVNNFEMTDRNNKVFLSAKEIDATVQKFDYSNHTYILDTLTINNSYTYFKLDSITNNFFKIFKLDNQNKVSENENQTQINDSIVEDISKEKILHYAINHLELNNGEIEYTDNLTGTPFNYHLSDILIDTDSINNDSEWINIHSEMLLNKRGRLLADLGINPTNPLNSSINFSIENFLLSDINIYSNHFTGHSILEGDLFYKSNTTITNGNIVSENKLIAKNISVKKNQKGLYNLPLKFALFLLKDSDGDINLEIPIEGNINDPTVNVGKLVWKTFSNIILNAVTSPVKLLAGIIGGDPKEIEELTFSYLDTIPSNKNIEQLDKLLKIEQKKEGIKIEMVYYVDTQLQKEAIAKDEAGKLYYKKTKKDYLKDKKGFEEFLLSKTTSDSLNLNRSYMALTDSNKLDSIAKNNSKALISNIEKHLKIINDSTQIEILTSEPDDPINIGAKPTLKMKYSMLDEE